MADSMAAQSITSNYKISKPPGYEERNSESEDSISPPASPTTMTTDLTVLQANGQNGNQSGTEDDIDGGGEHDDGRKIPRAERGDVGIVNGIFNGGEDNQIYRQLALPTGDVVADGAGEKNSPPVEWKKGVVEIGVQERKGVVENGVQERKRGVTKDAVDGGAQGNKDDMAEKGTSPIKSQGRLNQSKEKTLTTKSRDVSEENVHGFIDDMEEAMVAVSTGEEGAADRMVANVKIFLPLVLCIVSELTTLRVKVKDFILENRGLQKEVRQMKKEIEERDAKDANVGNKTTEPGIPASSSVEQSRIKGVSSTVTTDEPQKQAHIDDEPVKKELRKIRSQNKELQRVNHSWEKYGKKLSVKHEIDLKKKRAQLAASDERRKELEKRLDEKFKEYDQTLLHARHSEGKHRAAAEQYKKDRDTLRKKYDEMTTQLREWIKEREQKDQEIQRLNQVVERQAVQKTHSKQTQLAEEGCAGHTKPTKRVVPREMVNDPAPILYLNIGEFEENTRKEKQPRASTSRPRSPRASPAEDNPMTLAKDELKDQVELYRQQIDVFRTDFIQERRDREKAVGQVDTLKKELEKSKKRLEEMQNDRFEHDMFGLGQDYVPRRPREETHQKVRGGRNTGYGRQYAYQNYVDPGNHVYSVIED